MKNKSLFTALAFLFFTIVSCKQKSSQLAVYVPEDATAVFVVDVKSLTDKISSSGISIDSLAGFFNKNDLTWNDLKSSGIDLDKSLYAFSKSANSVQLGKTESFGLIAEVEDETALEIFLKKKAANSQVQSGNKYKYIKVGNGYAAGWNNKIFILSGVNYNNEKNAVDTASAGQLAVMFAQKESSSVASINEFNSMLKKTGDVHFWLNASGNLNSMPMMGMTKINELLQGTYTEGVIDFKNGQAVASMESHVNKTLSGIIKKYPAQEIKKDMITRYPGSLNAFGVVSFNPKVLLDILHFLGFDMMADGFAQQMGFTTNDVLNALSGDIAVMFARGGNDTIQVFSRHDFDFMVSLAIGDKAAFDKVMNGLISKGLLSKTAYGYQLGMSGGHGFIIKASNKELLIGSDNDVMTSYIAGNGKATLPADIEKEINNKSMAVYLDVNAMLKRTSATDTSNRKTKDLAQATFKNFMATTDKSNDKTIASNFTLNFINTKENSLAGLTKFMAVAQQEQAMHKSDRPAYPPSFIPDSDSSPDTANRMNN